MSAISDALKNARQVFYLLALDFDGRVLRFATKNISVSKSGEAALLFQGRIQSLSPIGSKYNLASNTYSLQSVNVQIINADRLQDEEVTRRLDGGSGKIYIWCDGLAWDDIETDGLLFAGAFRKNWHNLHHYNFTLTDAVQSKTMTIPPDTINSDTWPNHRTAGGAGSVAGLPQALLLGDWPNGVPLRCVDTAGFKYLAGRGVLKSIDADYTDTTENVYDKDGAVIAAAGYTFYPGGIDGLGSPAGYFDFTADQVASEPLACSIRGLIDGDGEITGTAGTLIEHPADMAHYLLRFHSALDSIDIGEQSIKTMRARLPGYKFASIVNRQAGSLDVIIRLLSQCDYARIQRAGKTGVVGLHTGAVDVARLKRYGQIGKTVRISKTDDALVINDLRVQYALNPATGQYEGELRRDRGNHAACEQSYYQYGAREQVSLQLPDVQSVDTATAITHRRLELFAFRHDIVERTAPAWDGFDVLEGDAGLLTIAEGPSADGSGWTDEKCILLDRTFNHNTITQRWWRVSV